MRRKPFKRRTGFTALSSPPDCQGGSGPLSATSYGRETKRRRKQLRFWDAGMGSDAGTAAAPPETDGLQELQPIISELTNSSSRVPQISVCLQAARQVECSLFYPTLPPVHSFAVSEAPLSEAAGGHKCSSGFRPCGSHLEKHNQDDEAVVVRYEGRIPSSAKEGESKLDKALRLAAAAVLEAALYLPHAKVRLGPPPEEAATEPAGEETEAPTAAFEAPRPTAFTNGEEATAAVKKPPRESTESLEEHGTSGSHHSVTPKSSKTTPIHALPLTFDKPPLGEPLLVLLGGSSGSGKSSMLPLLVHLLSRTFPFLRHLSQWKDGGNAGSPPMPYALLSTDALRQVLRAFCPAVGGPPVDSLVRKLLFSSTYKLKDLVEAQLQQEPLPAATARPQAAEAGAAGEAFVQGCHQHEALQLRIDAAFAEELGFLRRPPIRRYCQSCGEEAPCCAVLGMLQQAVLLQHLALEPLVKSLMGSPGKEGAQGTCEGQLKLVLVEGVHLTPAFAARMQRLYGARCLSLVAFCCSREEHARRLSRRQREGQQHAAIPGAADAQESGECRGSQGPSESCRVPQTTQGVRQRSRSNSSTGENRYIQSLSCIRCAQLHLCLAAASTIALNGSSSSSGKDGKGNSSEELLGSDAAGLFLSETSTAATGAATAARGSSQSALPLRNRIAAALLGSPRALSNPCFFPVPTDDITQSLELVQQVALKQWGPP